MLQAANLLLAVIEGRSLQESFLELQRSNPQWPAGVRGAVRDLAWSTARAYRRGDVILRQLMKHEPPPNILALLLIALNRLQERPQQAHTVVDQAVEAAASIAPGLKGMVNGVLRNALRQQDCWAQWLARDEEGLHAHPAWWLQRLRTDHPQRWKEVVAAGNMHPPMSLRVNQRRSSVAAMQAELERAGIDSRPCGESGLFLPVPRPVAELPGYSTGQVSVQDAGAQRAGILLAPRAGERVLDACAAPGGKTAHLLELADIELLALEIDPARASIVEQNLKRLGLEAQLQVADCTKLEEWWDGRQFDRILADVPCSSSGVVRRHPDIKWLRREQDLSSLLATQRRILDALWQVLAPGGTMLYVTCSVFRQENAEQIERFLRRHGDAEQELIESCPEGQLIPNAEHDGFYFARLRKKL